MKVMISLTVLCLIQMAMPLQSNAKYLRLNFGVGYADHNLSSVKDVFKYYSDIPVSEMKLTDNYTLVPYYTFSATVLTRTRWRFGAEIGYFSTGARMAYSDYSGVYTIDNIVSYFDYKGFLNISVLPFKSDFNLDFGFSIGIMNPEIKFTENVKTHNMENEISESNSVSYMFFEPGLELIYIWNDFDFGINASYFFEFNNETKYKATGIRARLLAGFEL